jgi:predicted DNA-binding transcriptional regulator AlpA
MSNVRFYRARDLCGTAKTRKAGERGILPFSPALLWRKVRRGQFPPPVKLSDGVTAWRADEVDRWIAQHSGSATNEAVA